MHARQMRRKMVRAMHARSATHNTMHIRFLFVALIALVFLGAGCARRQSTPLETKSGGEPPFTSSSVTPRAAAPALPQGAVEQARGTATPIAHSVSIRNFMFSPPILTVKVGDTVIWDHEDAAPHTITSDTGGTLASGFLVKGQTYAHTFADKGIFDYHCNPHPWMKARIIVE